MAFPMALGGPASAPDSGGEASLGPFSFDECLGLMVDTMQAYGFELAKFRKENDDFKQMITILEGAARAHARSGRGAWGVESSVQRIEPFICAYLLRVHFHTH